MALFSQFGQMFRDPPPALAFEFSADGVAWANAGQTGFADSADAFSVLRRFAPQGSGKGGKRRPAAVLLPDYETRVSVLDFDSLPNDPAEQLPLVRFRLKKSVPFDIESASVGMYVQHGKNAKGKIEVVAAVVSLEVLARYEVLFRNAGLHPGDVGVAGLKALELHRGDDVSVVAKLAGKTLTVMVTGQGKLKLYRCLELEDTQPDDINAVLFPTFAYAEDELGGPVARVAACGFTPSGMPCPVEHLRARSGVAEPFNAGLLGYMEAAAH